MAEQQGSVYDPSMVQSAETYVSYEDYLETERASVTKNEWLDGVVYAMAGGSLEHSRLAMNITAVLKAALARCEVFQSDAMIFVRETNLATYSDGVVVCGGVESQKVERNGFVGSTLCRHRPGAFSGGFEHTVQELFRRKSLFGHRQKRLGGRFFAGWHARRTLIGFGSHQFPDQPADVRIVGDELLRQ